MGLRTIACIYSRGIKVWCRSYLIFRSARLHRLLRRTSLVDEIVISGNDEFRSIFCYYSFICLATVLPTLFLCQIPWMVLII